MKKIFLTLSLITTLSAHATNNEEMYGGILGASALAIGVESSLIAESGITKFAAHFTDTQPHDLVCAAALSCGLFGAHYFVTETLHKDILCNLAISTPLATLVCTHSAWNRLQTIPFIGKFFACDHTDCKGVCNHCKLKVGYRQALGAILIAAAIKKIRG